MKQKFTVRKIFICVLLSGLLIGLYVQNNSAFVWAIGEEGDESVQNSGWDTTDGGSVETTEGEAEPVYTEEAVTDADVLSFDLRAGDVTISENGASGYIYDEGTLTPVNYEDFLGKEFYIYQSDDGGDNVTSNKITITAGVTVTFAKLNSCYPGGAEDGAVYIDANNGRNIIIKLEGESVFQNIFYTNKSETGSLTIKDGTGGGSLILSPDAARGVDTAIGESGNKTFGLDIAGGSVKVENADAEAETQEATEEPEIKQEEEPQESCNHLTGLSYSVSENIIRESCLICGEHMAMARITAEDVPYDGNTHTAEVTYSDDWLGSRDLTPVYTMAESEEWDGAAGDIALAEWLLDPTPLHAGSYTASITISGTDGVAVTAVTSFTISRIKWDFYEDFPEDRDHIRADETKAGDFISGNNLNVIFELEEGIEVESGDSSIALTFYARAKEGYYLYNYTPQATITVPGYEPENAVIIIEKTGDNSYLNTISGLPDEAYSGAEVTVTISGAASKPEVAAKYTDGRTEDEFEARDIPISCDYVFTAAFEVQKFNAKAYSALALKTGQKLPAGTAITLICNGKEDEKILEEEADLFAIEMPETDSFSVKVIMDFSSVSPDEQIGADEGTLLSLDLVMTPAETVTGQAPALPEEGTHDLTVSLVPAGEYSITATDDNNNSAKLTLFHEASDGADDESKEEGMKLIFTSEDELPADLSLIFDAAEEETECYKNSEGQYVLNLSSNESQEVGVKLDSVLFPDVVTDYVFNVQWEMTGEECELIFSHEPDPVPSLGANGINALGFESDKRIFTSEDKLKLRLKYADLNANCSIKCELLRGDGEGGYKSTGFSKTVMDYGRLNGDGKINLDFTFKSLAPDSYCLMFTVTENDTEKAQVSQILKVPYYFILYKN